MLCSNCQSVFRYGFNGPFRVDYDVSYSALRDSDCKLCNFLLQALVQWDAFTDGCSTADVEKRLAREDGRPEFVFIVTSIGCNEVTGEFSPSQRTVAGLQFQRVKGRNADPLSRSYLEPLATVVICPRIAHSLLAPNLSENLAYRRLNSRPDLDAAKSWLKECRETHNTCSYAEHTPLPTRVIDVAGSEPRLVEAAGNGDYASLSHRWGESKPPSLEMDKLEAYKRGISLQTLPQTFRDAVHITRELGIRYLWIDSLCIIQDSREDWDREGAKMADVYRNAVLNLAATAATSCDSGMLQERALRTYQELPMTWQADADVVFASEATDLYDFENETPSTLKQRGWIVQERLLATRALSFGLSKMVWTCRESTRHESLGVPIKKLESIADWNAQKTRAEWLDMWYGIVEQYSGCSLTFESDRLPALSALSQTFQSKLESDFLAGLWKADLIRGLGWRAEFSSKEEPQFKHASEYVGPTWSWASCRHRVRFPHRASDDPDTFVSDVQLEGPTVRAVMKRDEDGRLFCHLGDKPLGCFPDAKERVADECEVTVLLLGRFSVYLHALVLQEAALSKRIGCIRSRTAAMEAVFEGAAIQKLTLI